MRPFQISGTGLLCAKRRSRVLDQARRPVTCKDEVALLLVAGHFHLGAGQGGVGIDAEVIFETRGMRPPSA